MPIYEYQGQQYDIATTDPAEAKRKILNHLSGANKEASLLESLKARAAEATGTIYQGSGYALGGLLAPFEGALTGEYDLSTRLTDQGTQHKKELMEKYGVPEGKEESFGQKAASVILTAPAQIAAMPFQPTDTMSELQQSGESPATVYAGGATEALGVGAGIGLPVTVGKGLVQKTLVGAGAGAAQDVATRQTIANIAETDRAQQMFTPTAETTGLAAVTGGMFGAGVHALGKAGEVRTTKAKEEQPTLEDVPADRGSKEAIEATILRNEKSIEYAEYKLKKIEEDLNDPANAKATREEAEQYRSMQAERAMQLEKEIQELKNSNRTAEEMLGRGEAPAVMRSGRESIPSSLPPRPEGEAFVRPEGEQGLPAEQAPNADLFDQPVTRNELDDTLEGYEVKEYPLESMEEINIEAPIDTRPISELDLDTVNDRLATVNDLLDSGEITMKEYKELFARRNQLEQEAEGIFGPQPQVIIKGGTKAEREAVQNILKEVGLDKERLDIDLDAGHVLGEGARGTADAVGMAGKISVAPIKSFKKLLEESPRLQRILNEIPKEQVARFEKLMTTTHEIGHILLYKLLQTDMYVKDLDATLAAFDKWKLANDPEARAQSQLYRRMNEKDQNYYLQFPEFFAQRVSRALTLGDKAPVDIISRYIKQFKQIFNKLRSEFKVSLTANNMVDDLITKIVADNKASLETTGKTLFEIASTKRSLEDALALHNKKYDYKAYDTFQGKGAAAPIGMKQAIRHIDNADDVIAQQSSVPDINPAGVGTIRSLASNLMVKGGSWLFGIQQKAQMFGNSPIVKYASDVILNGLHKQTQRSMELLTGVTDRAKWTDAKGRILYSLQKMKNDDSFSVVADKSSNEDFYAVHSILEQGIGRYTYEESLAKFGGSFTEQQRTLFKAVTKMYGQMHDMAAGLEGELGKKRIIPNMKGWYPSVRKGEFIVNFRVAGLKSVHGRFPDGTPMMTDLVHSQSFRTEGEARAFIDQFERQSPEFKGRLQHNGVEKAGDTTMPQSLEEFHKAYKEQRAKINADRELTFENQPKWLQEELARNNYSWDDMLDARMQKMVDMYITRGGELGGHHKLRTNISGSMGSEMFSTTHDAGKAFRDANFSSVEEYTRMMMKMEIQEKLDLILSKDELRQSHPNTMEVAQLMRDYALNEVESPFAFKGFKAAVDAAWEATWGKNPMRKIPALGAKKYHDAPVVDLVLGKASHFFYIHALMSRPAFWAAQGLQFLWAGRTMVKDGAGPIDAMTAAGKGFFSVIHPQKDFLDGLFWVSQNSHTFAPQFVNDLNKFGITDFMKEGGKGKLLFDLVSGEKQSTMADSFSRLMTFGWMYEHYKAKGLSGENLWKEAANATDENMVQYGRQYKAPVFQKAGVVGDLMSPLQTFSQAALGNIISDVGAILQAPGGKAKLRASLPFIATMGITSLMAGAIGAPLVAEYEALRLLVNHLAKKLGMEELMPSIVDFALQGDNTFSNRVVSHGLIGASTMAVNEEGFDIAASNRWQPIWGGIFTGEKTFMESIPVINFMLDQAGFYEDLWGNALGISEKTKAERRTASMGVTPGWYKAIVDEAIFKAGEREMVPSNKGDAFMPQTGAERASKFMGTSTINASTERIRQRRMVEKRMRDQKKISKQFELLADAVQAQDSERITQIASKLGTEWWIDSDAINQRLEQEMYNRTVPAGIRPFMGRTGSSSTEQQKQYKKQQETYGVDPLDPYQEWIQERQQQ